MSLSVGFLEENGKKTKKSGNKRKRDLKSPIVVQEDKSEIKRPVKRRKTNHYVGPKNTVDDVLSVEKIYKMLTSENDDEVRSALHVLRGEKLTVNFLNNEKFPIADMIYNYRSSDDELIHSYSTDLISEWIKKDLYRPIKKRVKNKLSESEVKKLMTPTGDPVRDFVITSISLPLINLMPDELRDSFSPEKCVEISKEIEIEIHNSTSGQKMRYKRKFMEINPHLKDLDNDEFRRKLLQKEISAKKLITMKPTEMASSLKNRERERLKKKKTHMQQEYKKDDVKDGLYECRRCGSKKCNVYELQTRCADEPMTQYISCVKCGKRWRR